MTVAKGGVWRLAEKRWIRTSEGGEATELDLVAKSEELGVVKLYIAEVKLNIKRLKPWKLVKEKAKPLYEETQNYEFSKETCLRKVVVIAFSEIDKELDEALKRKIFPFFRLLGNAVVGPTFRNSFVEENGSERPIGVAMCREEELFPERFDASQYIPRKINEERRVVYGRTTVYESIRLALRELLMTICRELEADDFLEYLAKLSNYYERTGLLFAELVAEDTRTDLDTIARYVYECYHRLPRGIANRVNDAIEISSTLLRALQSNIYEVRSALLQRQCIDEDRMREYIERASELQREERLKILSASDGLDKYLRNMVAHAGLEYSVLERILLTRREGKVRVEKIVYSLPVLRKVLEQRRYLRNIAL